MQEASIAVEANEFVLVILSDAYHLFALYRCRTVEQLDTAERTRYGELNVS